MDYLHKLIRDAKLILFGFILLSNLLLIGGWWIGVYVVDLNKFTVAAALAVIAVLISILISSILGNQLMAPLESIWQTILHLSNDGETVRAPEIDKLHLGRDVVSNLSTHIYQLISVADKTSSENAEQAKDLSNNFVAQNLPLPLIVLDSNETIKFANPAAGAYLGTKTLDLVGKNVYMVLDLAFPSEDTFDRWLKTTKETLPTASNTWERVRMDVRDNHPTRLFDLAAYYNSGNTDQNETMLLLFDHTKKYSQDDQAISFVALSVHELRTPLTLLRGYIEVFQEELSGKLDPDMQSFMEKMQAQAEQLMTFVDNILNVARIDDNQLELKLEKNDWNKILTSTIANLSLRAKVRGITLNCIIAPNLPPVGLDAISIQEVVNNIVDNAIKYSGSGKTIEIDAHTTNDGLVETTVKDYGLGISTAALPNLFTKFYRDQHNRSQIGGTGLGLYISKSIVTAHGGNLWVRSKEGEGSVFGFTLKPYDQLASEAKASGEDEMVRSAHGWIKNHSLYRR